MASDSQAVLDSIPSRLPFLLLETRTGEAACCVPVDESDAFTDPRALRPLLPDICSSCMVRRRDRSLPLGPASRGVRSSWTQPLMSGEAEGWPQLPDSEFLPPMDYYAIEKTINQFLINFTESQNPTKPHPVDGSQDSFCDSCGKSVFS